MMRSYSKNRTFIWSIIKMLCKVCEAPVLVERDYIESCYLKFK